MISRLLFGPPLPTAAAEGERLNKSRAIGAFGLDALSSVAYGPDEILYVLLLAGAAGTALNLPIALAITALLAIVAVSYRQTIFAYPRRGGSYTVARENLGRAAGLIAAAALMVDYLTTVAVSVTAGVQAIGAFVPVFDQHRVIAGVCAISLLMLINLRGVREAGAAFVIPTYAFIGSLGLLVVVGLVRVVIGNVPVVTQPAPSAVEGLSLFLVLRAFAGGCTAMTGVEAIANGVPAFEKPEQKNAAATLITLALLLGGLFLGVAFLGKSIGAVPSDQTNIVEQIGSTFAGGTPLYYLVQLSSSIILLLAANTSFNGFPRLAAIMAEDDYFPHQFSHRGIRLAYSNGINVIGVLAIILVVAFHGSTHALIPLFAVGVFMCFTLSQSGMVLHWWRSRDRGWGWKLAVNGGGALVTAAVTLIVVSTKFTQGAWIVLLLVPLIVWAFIAVHNHYQEVRSELFLPRATITGQEPQCMVVPVSTVNKAVEAALEYACSISQNVTAVHIAVDDEIASRFQDTWSVWAPEVPLKIVPSPFREVVSPLVDVIDEFKASSDGPVTVVLPEVLPRRLWQNSLHNQLGFAIQLALLGRPGVIVTSVPVRLPDRDN
ncbi:MAG: APC family permease [Chloroflexi bacterium]|nr:APC family permease [Chloroflexota bacterium]